MNKTACLTTEIGTLFPSIRKPRDYAKVIMVGLRLKARDARSAKKRVDFLATGQIKPHIFVQSYMKRCILTPIRNAERRTAVCSERLKKLVFSTQVGYSVLNTERRGLLDHARLDAHVLSVVTKVLKLDPNSSIADVQKAMEHGDLYRQVVTYESAYNELGRQGMRRLGYKWLGVRTTPVSRYYTSRQSDGMLARCGEREVKR